MMNLTEKEKLKVIEMFARKFPVVHKAIGALSQMEELKNFIDSSTDFLDESSRLAFDCFYENVMEEISHFLNNQARQEGVKNSN